MFLIFSSKIKSISSCFISEIFVAVKPNAIIHLGDHFDDGAAMAQEYPHIRFHQVVGNCDKYRLLRPAPEILCYDVCGVRLFMTHGHRHNVKITTGLLLADGARNGAAAALYGHTHIAECRQLPDGMWILNPGACGSFGGSAGLVKIIDGQIKACSFITAQDLEV